MVTRKYYNDEVKRLKRELKSIDAAIKCFERLNTALPSKRAPKARTATNLIQMKSKDI